MKYTKKSLKELMDNKDFHSFRWISYELNAYANRIDSRDYSIEFVLNDIKNIKGRIHRIACSYYTQEEFIKKQIAEWKELGETSPVDYLKIVGSDCNCNDCKEKYWPKGCWYNVVESEKMQRDSSYDYFWFHDKKRKKEYELNTNFEGYDVISVPDSYVFQVWTEKVWSRHKVILGFWLQFTEYGWLRFPKEKLKDIIKQLTEWGFILKDK